MEYREQNLITFYKLHLDWGGGQNVCTVEVE